VGGCTTHYTTLVAWRLYERGVVFTDYPNLVRLNPSIPWKTRGNGATALRLLVGSESDLEDIAGLLLVELEEYLAELRDPKHQPCLVVHAGSVPRDYEFIAEKALHDIVPLSLVERVLAKYSTTTRVYCHKGRRGLVGALAAIGYTMMSSDYTYELLAYRLRENCDKPRCVDSESVVEIDRIYGNRLILNYDYETRRVLITPRGPDPVLLGIRGEDPYAVLEAFKRVRVCEPVEYYAIYRTNQHIDSHIYPVKSICDIRPYMCVSVRGRVSSKPRRHIGGHLFFKLCDSECCITVAVYEPTKEFRDVVEKLEAGDLVEVYGCTRPPSSKHDLTLNLEKIRVIELVEVYVYENPKCPVCGSRMKSAGRNKGFKCEKCGFRDLSTIKIARRVERGITPGWYQPPKHAFKHLMKPVERIGREKRGFRDTLIDGFIAKLH
jgi:tRNA(Ile2)-agmatinylcytidine synthase